MILSELTGIKQASQDTLAAFLNQLIRSGKAKVHNGSFSFVVVPKDKDFVYKVWTRDDAWEHYLAFVEENRGNPSLIKTFGGVREIPMTFKRPESFDATFKVLKIEKLYSLDTDHEAYGMVLGLLKQLKKVKVEKLTAADARELGRMAQDEEATKEAPSYQFICTVIDVLQSKGPFHNDLHTENVMKRANGELVITDPYCSVDAIGAINITASDILQGKFYGKHDERATKSGRSPS